MSTTIFGILSHFSFLSWGLVVLAGTVWFLSVLILLENVEKKTSEALVVLTSIVLLWGIAYGAFQVLLETSLSQAATIFYYGIMGLVAPATFFLADTFTNQGGGVDIEKRLLTFLTPYVLVLALLLVPSVSVSCGNNDELLHFGWGFVVYVSYVVGVLAVTLRSLLRKYRTSAGIFTREVMLFVGLFGSASVLGMGAALFAPLASGTLDAFPVSFVLVLATLTLVGFGIIRYNFWSFKVIATEFFISFVGFILLIELFFAASLLDLVLRAVIAILVLLASFFLVDSVKREFETRDKIARLLRDLDQINARLRVLDKKKSEFLSTASHHLRDPLTSIQGYASMIMEGSFGEVSAGTQEALGKIFESSKRLITIISDFLDISNIESGDMKYVFEEVDFKKMVRDLSEDMRSAAERSGLALSLVVKGGERIKYITTADQTKLRQVVSNLIDNAIKYTPAGSIEMVLSKTKEGKILLSIHDTGIGMSEDTLAKIFKKFSRAEGVSRVYTEGTGLGLYVAHEIMKKHNGRIWAESEGEKRGSTFYVELAPAERVDKKTRQKV